FFEGDFRNSDRHRANADSTPVEDPQRIDESLVLVPEESVLRELTIRQDDLRCGAPADSQLVFDLSDRETGVPPFRDERADSAVRFRGIRNSMDHESPRDRSIGAEGLRAVQDPSVF